MEQPELPKKEGSLFLGCANRACAATWPLRRNLHMPLWCSLTPASATCLVPVRCPCTKSLLFSGPARYVPATFSPSPTSCLLVGPSFSTVRMQLFFPF